MAFEWSTSAKLISSVTEGNIEGAKEKIDGVSGKKDEHLLLICEILITDCLVFACETKRRIYHNIKSHLGP